MPNTYTITPEQKTEYEGLFVLKNMDAKSLTYSTNLADGSQEFLRPILVRLMGEGLVNIVKDRFMVTGKGLTMVSQLTQMYQEYLDFYDVFSKVDPVAGEFAFERFFENDQAAWQSYFGDRWYELVIKASKGKKALPEWADLRPTIWQAYLDEPRWRDFRLMVATARKADPVRIVFMAFLNEGNFDTSKPNWEFDLVLGTFWKQVLDVCNTADSIDQIEAASDQERNEILGNVIKRGMEVMVNLRKQEAKLQVEFQQAQAAAEEAEQTAAASGAQTEVVTETVVETTTYEEYDDYYSPWLLDPFYPCYDWWYGPLFTIYI